MLCSLWRSCPWCSGCGYLSITAHYHVVLKNIQKKEFKTSNEPMQLDRSPSTSPRSCVATTLLRWLSTNFWICSVYSLATVDGLPSCELPTSDGHMQQFNNCFYWFIYYETVHRVQKKWKTNSIKQPQLEKRKEKKRKKLVACNVLNQTVNLVQTKPRGGER